MTQTKALEKRHTIASAAEILGIPQGTLRKHLPEMETAKLGRLITISETALAKWVESRTSKPLRELQSA